MANWLDTTSLTMLFTVVGDIFDDAAGIDWTFSIPRTNCMLNGVESYNYTRSMYEVALEVPCDQRPNDYEYCVPPAAVGNDPNVMPHPVLAAIQGFMTGAAAGLRTVASALPTRASPPPDTPIDLTVWAVDAVRADFQSVAAQSVQSMTAYKDVDAARVRHRAACKPCLTCMT